MTYGNGYITVSTATTTSSNMIWYAVGGGGTGSTTVVIPQSSPWQQTPVELAAGMEALLPDGTVIKIDQRGNFKIVDTDAKVIYKACRVREFNRYLNASDLLEKFIDDVGLIDRVTQEEILRLPIEAFINWLVLEAAKADGDSVRGLPSVESALPAPASPALPPPAVYKPRCGCCGRFIKKAFAAAQIHFCSPEHFQRRLIACQT